jgi:hypothetical protein
MGLVRQKSEELKYGILRMRQTPEQAVRDLFS